MVTSHIHNLTFWIFDESVPLLKLIISLISCKYHSYDFIHKIFCDYFSFRLKTIPLLKLIDFDSRKPHFIIYLFNTKLTIIANVTQVRVIPTYLIDLHLTKPTNNLASGVNLYGMHHIYFHCFWIPQMW